MTAHGTFRKSEFSLGMSGVGCKADVIFEAENVAD